MRAADTGNYDTLIGRDGWLFMSRIDKLFEKHRGEVTLSGAELRHWQLTLELRQSWMKQRGAEYCFFVAPNKASIYPEFLPDGYAMSGKRPLSRLKSYLSRYSEFALIDPSDELRRLKSIRVLYHQTDEHWNDFGAYKAYRYFLDCLPSNLSLTPVAEERLKERKRKFVGELSVLLPTPQQEHTFAFDIEGAQARLLYENKRKGRGKIEIRENSDRSLPRAVFFRDSFASALLPYLAESFSRIVSVSSRQVFFDLLESERPDIVITEMVERYLDPVSDDVRSKSVEEYCEVSLETIRGITLDTGNVDATKAIG